MKLTDFNGRMLGQLTDLNPVFDKQRVDKECADYILKTAQEDSPFSYPTLTATDWLSFTRTGNRADFEKKYFSRRKILGNFILAELIDGKGVFLDDILNGLASISTEVAWQLPAHNSYLRDTVQLALPDPSRPILDIFACETGALLSLGIFLLQDQLNAMSPFLAKNIQDLLDFRIVQPYLGQHFWWMGEGDEKMCNWTPWCTQNILLSVFLLPTSQKTRHQVVSKALYSLDCFLKDYGEDGCCDEGAQYYHHAGLALFACLDVLNKVSRGQMKEAYEDTKIRNIAQYIMNMHVKDRYYLNFSDCSPFASLAGVKEFCVGKAISDPLLMAFAHEQWELSSLQEKVLKEEINLAYRLLSLLCSKEIDSCTIPYKPNGDIFYKSVGILVSRDNNFTLAVKGGGNNDNHNHNDTGSLILYCKGQPLLIDIGVETYTRKTFSADRYEIWTMRSLYHNVVNFPSKEQKAGPSYQSSEVKVSLGDKSCSISMQLAKAYEQVDSYERVVIHHKNHSIEVLDTTSERGTLTVMTQLKPMIKGNSMTIGNLGRITFKNASKIKEEPIEITDPRLLATWNSPVYRVLVDFIDRLQWSITPLREQI